MRCLHLYAAPAEAPRKLPAVVSDDEDRSLVEPQKRKKRRKKQRADELTSETVQAGQTTINIINQVAAPAPVYVSPYWGWWGGCPHWDCPRRAGRSCWRLWCWW
jgi:hypothetical protein